MYPWYNAKVPTWVESLGHESFPRAVISGYLMLGQGL